MCICKYLVFVVHGNITSELEHELVYVNFVARTSMCLDCYKIIQDFGTVLFYHAFLHVLNLHLKEEITMSEVHGMSVPCTELSFFNNAKVNSFSLYGTFKHHDSRIKSKFLVTFSETTQTD